MRRRASWAARAVATLAAVAAGPAAAHAQEFSIQGDYRVVEGNTNASLFITITRTTPGPISDVTWRTVNGSAVGGADFVTVTGGFVQFLSPDVSKTITVTILGDGTPEPSAGTTLPDEVFFVELTNVTAGTIARGRASVSIIDDDYAQPGVQFLSVVTDMTGPSSNQGRNRLQWRVPAAQPSAQQVVIAWTSGSSSCTPPVSDTAGEAPGPVVIGVGPADAGTRKMWTHNVDTLPNYTVQVPRVYCYSVFTRYPALSAQRAEAVVETFDASAGPVKWTYTPGYYFGSPAPSVVPPTVGADAIYTVGTDGVVHAMQRGVAGGLWPLTWEPVALGKPAHNRSPVVPLASGPRLFVGTESGEVHAIDGRSGAVVWSRSQRFGTTQLMPGVSTGVQATPAGLFKAWGGENDLILVGTSVGAGATKFFALSPATGVTIDDFPNGTDSPPGPIDNVLGMAVVDYRIPNRVYFATTGIARTLWSLDLGVGGTPDLTMSGLAWSPKPLGTATGVMGSPVFRGDRLYFDVDSGAAASLYALTVADGSLSAPYNHGDGPVKGFPWPDRRDTRLYFATDNKVHGVRDDGATISALWTPIGVTSPSIVLQRPGTNELFVGNGVGQLLKIDVVSRAVAPIPLTAAAVQIGAPSLDAFHNLIHVGSGNGVIYAVRP